MSPRTRNLALRRAWVSLLVLIPFAIGSQRCLVGALGYGGAMRCLAIPTAHAEPRAAECCHGPAGATHRDAPARDVPTRSCCVEGAPIPAATTLDGAAAFPTALASAIAPDAAAPDDHAAPVAIAPDDSPPDPLQGSPPPTRAPPGA